MTACFGTNAALSGRRKSRRVSVALPASAELVTGVLRAELVSLSSTGAALDFAEEPPKLGAEIVLAFEHLECFGTIVWRNGSRAGINFYDPIDEAHIVEARRASDTRNEREARRLQSIARAWVEGRAAAAASTSQR